jgi:hypothetical protein
LARQFPKFEPAHPETTIVVGHHLRFMHSRFVAGQSRLFGFNEEEVLIRNDVLAIGQLQHDLPLRHWSADIFCPNAGLFPEFPDRRLLEGLPFLNTPAGSGSVILPRKHTALVDEAEEQDPSGIV